MSVFPMTLGLMNIWKLWTRSLDNGEREFNETAVEELKTKLARVPKARRSTEEQETGNLTTLYPAEQADECLEDTKGFRFMGQRFIPDSYIFSNMVAGPIQENIQENNRNTKPFTFVISKQETDPRLPARA